MRRYLPLMAILAAGALAHWRQDRALADLHAALARLGPILAEHAELAAQNQAWRGVSVDLDALRALREDRLELLGLRGAIGELRLAGRLEPERMKHQIAEAGAKAEEARREEQDLRSRMEAEDRSKEVRNALGTLAALVRATAGYRDGVLPRTWDEVRQSLVATRGGGSSAAGSVSDPDREAAHRQSLLAWLDGLYSAPVKPADFELLPVVQDMHGADPQSRLSVLILRERVPRAIPDGGWARAYAFLNGMVVEAESADGDFSDWEREAGRRQSTPQHHHPYQQGGDGEDG